MLFCCPVVISEGEKEDVLVLVLFLILKGCYFNPCFTEEQES